MAYALAGRATIDFEREPLGRDQAGREVFLRDIWPSQDQIRDAIARSLTPKMFEEEYGNAFRQNETWNAIPVPRGQALRLGRGEHVHSQAEFLRWPSPKEIQPIQPIQGARVLAKLGDSVTTDHISPAGSIAVGSPGGEYLAERGVERKDWNSYGSRRGKPRGDDAGHVCQYPHPQRVGARR